MPHPRHAAAVPRRTRRHQHVIPVIGHLIDGQFREVGEEHRQAAGIARHDMLDTGHNEPHGRSVMIKFLDGQDHHRAAVLMRGPLLDCRHSRMQLSSTVSNGTTQKSPDPDPMARNLSALNGVSAGCPGLGYGLTTSPGAVARGRWSGNLAAAAICLPFRS